MSTDPLASPFDGVPVRDIPLTNSPLVRVLAQIRFPRLSALAGGNAVATAFAAACAADYPILDVQQEMTITVGPEGVTQTPGAGQVWHLRSADETWQLSFGDAFFAIDTAAYSDRAGFRNRLETSWSAFCELVKPPFTERIGVRYINRVVDPEVISDLPSLLRAEVLGGMATPLHHALLSHSVTETLYQVDATQWLQTRWGILPPGAIFDPTILAAPGASWLLDIDSYRTAKDGVESVRIGEAVEEMAKRSYKFFRWITNDDFLARFGAVLVD